MTWHEGSTTVFVLFLLYAAIKAELEIRKFEVGLQTKVDSSSISFIEKKEVTASLLFSQLVVKASSVERNKDSPLFRIVGGAHERDARVANSAFWYWPFRSGYSVSHTENVSPFENFYFTVEFYNGHADHRVTISCELVKIWWPHVFFMVGGIFLLFLAPRLSRSAMFHYSSGISVGMIFAWMFLVMMLLKFMPYKKFFTAAVFACGSAGLYFGEQLLTQGIYLVQAYPYAFAGYSAMSILITIALIYYFGPVTNERALNLIQWTLQLTSLLLIFISSYHKPFTVTVIVVSVTVYVLSRYVSLNRLLNSVNISLLPRVSFFRIFPAKRTFLTLAEYEEEGRTKTAAALEELRRFCFSPDCPSWEIISKIKDPKRFADFLKGGSQFTREELDSYDNFDPVEQDLRHEWFSEDDSFLVHEDDTRPADVSHLSSDR